MPTPGSGEQDDKNKGAAGSDSGEQDKDKSAAGSKTGEKDIQSVIDAIIARERKDAQARIDAERAKVTTLEERIAALEKPADKSKAPKGDKAEGEDGDEAYAERIRKPLLDKLAELEGREKARADSTKRARLEADAKDLAVDGAEADVAAALLGRVKLTDAGGLEVVDAEGRIEYGASGPKTVKELITEHLRAKPYLAKASVRSGLGLGGAPKGGSASTANRDALKQQIAKLEAEGKFGEVAVLKSQLLDLK